MHGFHAKTYYHLLLSSLRIESIANFFFKETSAQRSTSNSNRSGCEATHDHKDLHVKECIVLQTHLIAMPWSRNSHPFPRQLQHRYAQSFHLNAAQIPSRFAKACSLQKSATLHQLYTSKYLHPQGMHTWLHINTYHIFFSLSSCSLEWNCKLYTFTNPCIVVEAWQVSLVH